MDASDLSLREYEDDDDEGRRRWVEIRIASLKRANNVQAVSTVSTNLRNTAQVDNTVAAVLAERGETLERVTHDAYLRIAHRYYDMLDTPLLYNDGKLLLGRFQPMVEFENYEGRLQQMREALQREGTNVMPPFADSAAMEEAIAQKLRNIHAQRARSWYDVMMNSADDFTTDPSPVNPLLATLRLQYHIQQAGGDYSLLDSSGEDNADVMRRRVNAMAQQIWDKHYRDSIATCPQVTDETITPDAHGYYHGVYVFSRQTELALAATRQLIQTEEPETLIQLIIRAMQKTGLPLSELFPESGMTSAAVKDMLREHLIDQILIADHENPVGEMSEYERTEAIAELGVVARLNRAGFNQLGR